MDGALVERLGDPVEIAASAAREFGRRRSLLARSPVAAFCTFVLLPLPVALLAWCVALAGLFALGAGAAWWMGDSGDCQTATSVDELLVHLGLTLAVVLSPAAITPLFAALARRTAHHWRWGLVANGMVALLTSLVFVNATYAEPPGKGMIAVGLQIGPNFHQVAAIGQFLVPMAAGYLVLRRSIRNTAPSPDSVAEPDCGV